MAGAAFGMTPASLLRYRAGAVAVILLGLGSLFAFFSIRANDRKIERDAFERAAQVNVAAIQLAVERVFESLESGGTLFDASGQVTTDQFRAFGLRALQRNPALKAVSWAPLVTAKDRPAFEREAGKEIPNFEITQVNEHHQMVPATERDEYFPIRYSVDRSDANPYGFDIATPPHARDVLLQSMASGNAAAGGMTRLLTGADKGKLGFPLFRPVYRAGMPHDTAEQRRRNLLGFAGSVIVVSAQINDVLDRIGAPSVEVALYDQSAPPGRRFFAVWPQLAQEDPIAAGNGKAEPLESKALIEVGGRDWLAVMTPVGGRFGTAATWHPWAVLAAGIAFSILLAFYLELVRRVAGKARRRSEDLETALRDNEKMTRELHAAQSELLATARQAGMAEIANNVLHNVGNVLNSVNVSAGLVNGRMRDSKGQGLGKAVRLMNEHAADLGDFLTRDEKGKLLPGYLNKLVGALATEQQSVVDELGSLTKSIEHIKDIVSTQQSYAGVASVIEPVQVRDLVEDALRINAGALARHHMIVVKEIADMPLLLLDKSRLLQILVNLMVNAEQAMDSVLDRSHRMTLRTEIADFTDGRGLRIRVEDDGEGIPPENLARLFVHGFTTRRNGHGFGLHSCALAAKEMGGTLTAQSDGPGKGAAFTLELPIKPEDMQ